jgi:Kyakuja-Dileera-Zisupton transposase
LEIYDIGCHWWTNFFKRLELNPTMDFNESIDFIVAVGKFHLGAHVKECFFKYSLNFITGAGQVDGEIMETLWSLFNKFAKMARSMGTAHRREILNDHMRDVNWKKMVGMGKSAFDPYPSFMLII